tara:strand:+ start:25434 stop:25658 length:225 start_codon:yes stop_codon:yes gene_type:complete
MALSQKQQFVVRGYGTLSMDERKEVLEALKKIDATKTMDEDRLLTEELTTNIGGQVKSASRLGPTSTGCTCCGK